MPRGDRTGPSGGGPMTGRGAGFCTGNNQPGYASYSFGRGFSGGQSGRGFGRGMGRGFFSRRGNTQQDNYYPEQERPLSEEEVFNNLKNQRQYLEGSITNIDEQIKNLKKTSKKNDQ